MMGTRDVTQQLGITSRRVRFLQEAGLINPQRFGNARLFTLTNFRMIQSIIAAQGLGLTLAQIKGFQTDEGIAVPRKVLVALHCDAVTAQRTATHTAHEIEALLGEDMSDTFLIGASS